MRIRCNIIEPRKLEYQILEQEEAWYSLADSKLAIHPHGTVWVRSSIWPALSYAAGEGVAIWLRGEAKALDDSVTVSPADNFSDHYEVVVLQRVIITALLAQARTLNCPFSLEA